MAIASFAGKTFQVSNKKVYTLTEFTTGSGLQTEKQDVAGKKPSTYIKGADLETMSFSIPLNISFGYNVQSEFDSWKAIMTSQKAQNFILGTKPFGAKWLLTNVSLGDTLIDKKGNLIKGTLQLQFEEYVRAGSAKASSSLKKGTAKAKGVTASDKSILDSLISGSDKSTQKRTNSNAVIAVSGGVMGGRNMQW
jgi:hypothetical protein